MKVAGVVGPTAQAVAEAGLARDLGYDLALLSLGALREATTDELLAHCRAVAEVLPLVRLLPPARGGRPGPRRGLLAPLPRDRPGRRDQGGALQPLPDARRRPRPRRERPRRRRSPSTPATTTRSWPTCSPASSPARGSPPVRFAGGLLGQWAVWTRRAVELLAGGQGVPADGPGAPSTCSRSASSSPTPTPRSSTPATASPAASPASTRCCGGRASWPGGGAWTRARTSRRGRRRRSTASSGPTPTSPTTSSWRRTSTRWLS